MEGRTLVWTPVLGLFSKPQGRGTEEGGAGKPLDPGQRSEWG